MTKDLRLEDRIFQTSPWASQVVLVVKNLSAHAGEVRDVGSIPGSGISPRGGNGNPLQDSCVKNPMDRSLVATDHGVTKSWIRLSIAHNSQLLGSTKLELPR